MISTAGLAGTPPCPQVAGQAMHIGLFLFLASPIRLFSLRPLASPLLLLFTVLKSFPFSPISPPHTCTSWRLLLQEGHTVGGTSLPTCTCVVVSGPHGIRIFFFKVCLYDSPNSLVVYCIFIFSYLILLTWTFSFHLLANLSKSLYSCIFSKNQVFLSLILYNFCCCCGFYFIGFSSDFGYFVPLTFLSIIPSRCSRVFRF